ncbi:hypothetical protein EIP91_011192 [Steccherinum ochraceum]|uniref:DUF6534 domain-containing protein n=1 Tax=Steccherinum ochraceum TaxID=92696 RepID=A0A4R0R226_9APHY|nr:hypothetical protein EIP91_011192 [Steccherinum ochraceum]
MAGQSLNLSLLLGPLLLTQFMNWGLFGVLTVQLYIYYLAFPKDRIHGKALVGVVYILEIVQLAMTTHDAFFTFAAQWGDILHLDTIKTMWFSVPILTGLIGCLVQLFYAWRIQCLGRNTLATSLVVMTALLGFASSVWDGVVDKAAKHIEILTHTRGYLTAILWLSTTALCDILITLSMSYYLYKAKKTSSVRRTTVMLTRLITYTIETGLLTAAFSIVEAVLFVTSTDTLLYGLFMGITPKLYSNCLLALFNSRIQVDNGRITNIDGAIPLSDVGVSSRSGHNSSLVRTPESSRHGITIEISKVSDAHRAIEDIDLGFDDEHGLPQKNGAKITSAHV